MKKLILTSFLFFFVGFALMAQPKIIAHRGFWDKENSAENSIISLYKAYEAGCYGVEFDVQITSDGVLILNHDDILNGMVIQQTPYDKLRDIRLKNNEVIPTLGQYLVHAKNCPGIKLIMVKNRFLM
ncbi:glycerophosphodiester phosphodiesterase [Proteiniphilum propionicum]|uniref:glycerophosphodiester phosphodiesterase n=1 Tax=Proteiniphilum propionicum TaxID=2829812 RepID=UPI001EEA4B21|nr:glycerophosphodiester phosphodiesterase family protein [Proteiniphilum propionicum]MDD2245307.1 glycerophosphodiester phosphodiesterase family protein [Dysgonamonadaceae bacterium]ULB35461.1 hypothetical protein KDN43_05335 [Proteiniphilum propionicum]